MSHDSIMMWIIMGINGQSITYKVHLKNDSDVNVYSLYSIFWKVVLNISTFCKDTHEEKCIHSHK